MSARPRVMRTFPSAVTLPSLAGVAALTAWWWPEGREAALSLATGYTAAALLLLTLLVTPWYRRRRHAAAPVHLPLRRSLGVHAALLAVAHVVVSVRVHLGGDIRRYFFDQGWDPLATRFGLSNWVGLAATAAIVVLLVTSNDASLRFLGPHRWKRIHWLVWPAAVLVVLHTIGYQDIRGASATAVAALAVGILVLVVARLATARTTRAVRDGRRP